MAATVFFGMISFLLISPSTGWTADTSGFLAPDEAVVPEDAAVSDEEGGPAYHLENPLALITN